MASELEKAIASLEAYAERERLLRLSNKRRKAIYYQRLSADLYRLERTMRDGPEGLPDNCIFYQQHAAQVAHMARRALWGVV